MGLILNELITNAIKHGPSDGFARIELSGRRAEDGGYVIELADNGPGMAEEYRPGGLGKRLVESLASKGGIRVDRLDGPGTRYRTSAPVESWRGGDSWSSVRPLRTSDPWIAARCISSVECILQPIPNQNTH